jgi:tetratricopeptide (TPR) repeat protein
LALLEGRFDEAEKLIAEARSIGERTLSWSAGVSHGLQLYVLRREQGRLEDVEDLVVRAATDHPTYPIWRCVLANMRAELASTAAARSDLDSLSTDRYSAIPFDEEWAISLCFLAETAARLGDTEQAATLYELLLPYADRVAYGYPEVSLGPVSRFLGILASTTARWDGAERHFTNAMELTARIGARPWLGHAREEYGRMLLERHGPGDTMKANELLSAAAASYRECGMDSHAAKAARAMRNSNAPA